MSRKATPKPRVNLKHSLLFKCTAMVAVCVALVVATIEVSNYRRALHTMNEDLQNRAQEVTVLMAMQLGGAIKFGDVVAFDEIVADVMEAAGMDAVGALIVDFSGETLFATHETLFAQQNAKDVIVTASETLGVAISPSGKIVAVPVSFGTKNEVVGFVVTKWTYEFHLAHMVHERMISMLVGLIVLICALCISGYFLRRYMSRPLIELEGAMKDVACGDYDVVIPHTARRDEIGLMAGRLEEFRLALAIAKEAARETAFKSAAFVGSTAQLLN